MDFQEHLRKCIDGVPLGPWLVPGCLLRHALRHNLVDLLCLIAGLPGKAGTPWVVRYLTRRHGCPRPLRIRTHPANGVSARPVVTNAGPSSLTSLVTDIAAVLRGPSNWFDTFVPRSRRSWEPNVAGRHRDVFPLPRCSRDWVARVVPAALPEWIELAVVLVNAGVAGLGVLAGFPVSAVAPSFTAAQDSILSIAYLKAERLLLRISGCQPTSGVDAFDKIFGPVGPVNQKVVPFVAEQCDLHPCSGQVDPDPILPEFMRRVVHDPALMCPSPPADLGHYGGPSGAERHQYLLFVARELEAGKVELVDEVAGGGTLFAVAKEAARLRPIWRGDRVSELAAAPPKPRHLASPAGLAQLITTPGAPFFMEKRDGESMFDQLLLPVELRPFMGQPRFGVAAFLHATGWSLVKLNFYWRGGSPLVETAFAFPISRVWCMGVPGALLFVRSNRSQFVHRRVLGRM